MSADPVNVRGQRTSHHTEDRLRASTTASLAAVEGFYQGIVDRTVAVSSPREAELAKLIENTFRHVNIALVNELAMFGRELGVDVWEAIDAASTKPFGFMPFHPGPGVGGHCLPIDPSYLSWRVERTLGQRFRFVELANDINGHMPDYVVRRLLLALNRRGRPVRGSRILLLGLAYKKNTGDARESPALRVAELLPADGSGGPGRRPAGDRAARRWTRRWPGSTPRRRRSPRPTSSCCSPTTMPSGRATSAATPVTCSTAAGCCPARTSRRSETLCERVVRLICVAPATIAQIPVAPYQRSVEVIGCQAGPFSAFDATSSPHVHATTSCPASAVVRGHLLRLRPSCRRPRPASASSV